MTREDKVLILKDLCARLPYGVKAKYYDYAGEYERCDNIEGIYPYEDIDGVMEGESMIQMTMRQYMNLL